MKRSLTILLWLAVTICTAWSQEKLGLNKGVKWTVDQVTAANARALQTVIRVRAAPMNLSACHQLASRLQIGVNKLMRECRVKGDDHTALHHWLEPLLEQVSLLAQAKNLNAAQKAYVAVVACLRLFDTHFKLRPPGA